MPPPQRRFVLKSLLLTLMVLSGVVFSAAGASAVVPVSYVALGDSYTAGPLIPSLDPFPRGCLRSTGNYPHLLATWFRVDSFNDVSCSGAETEDMFAPQRLNRGANPAQLDALTPSTRFVTLGIGGNDVGFTEIVLSCLVAFRVGTPCQDRYVVGGVDEISRRIQDTRPRIDEVLDEIKDRSPDAKIFVVGYPSLVPESGWGCSQLPYAPADLPYLVARETELNQMLSEQAAAKGAVYVDTYTPSLGHDACASAARRWVEPVKGPLQAAPVHPNAKGMVHAALAVAAAIRANS